MIDIGKYCCSVLISLALVSCGGGSSDSPDKWMPDPDPEVTEPLFHFFVTFHSEVDLAEQVETLTEMYKLEAAKAYPSSNTILASAGESGYNSIKKADAPYTIVERYSYKETSNFDEIVAWSRFFITEEDSWAWRAAIDSLFYLRVGESISVRIQNSELEGKIKKNEVSDYRYIVVDLNDGGRLTASYHNSRVTGRLVSSDHSYKYKFIDNYGYLMPRYEYDWLVGALDPD